MISKWGKAKPAKEEAVTTGASQEETPVVSEEVKFSYNVTFDGKNYFLDKVTYTDTRLVKVETTMIGNLYAVAMRNVTKIFTDKIILKKENV